jgi:hypothetical protein
MDEFLSIGISTTVREHLLLLPEVAKGKAFPLQTYWAQRILGG